MTNEEVLSIVKLKYPEAELVEGSKIVIGKSGHCGETVAEVLVCIEDNKIVHLHLKRNALDYIIECRSAIEYKFKNAIELKHLLNIEITRKDIVDYLEKELYSSYVNADGIGGWELTRTKEYDNLVVEEYKQDGNFQLSILRISNDGYSCSITSIFDASNSNEYWELYNIINNLIGENND